MTLEQQLREWHATGNKALMARVIISRYGLTLELAPASEPGVSVALVVSGNTAEPLTEPRKESNK